MTTIDYRQINQNIKEIHGKKLSVFSLETSISYIESLKSYISGSNKLEKVNSIVVLAKLLDYVPQSDSLQKLLDSNLFQNLIEIASNSSTPSETLRPTLRICVIYLTGSIAKTKTSDTYTTLLIQACGNYSLVENLSLRLFDADLRLVSTVIDFISRVLFRAAENLQDHLIYFVTNLKRVTFFTNFTALGPEEKAELERSGYLKNIAISIKMAEKVLRKTKINQNSKIHNKISQDLIEVLNKSLTETGKAPTAENFIKAGLTSDPLNYLSQNYSILTVMELYVFLLDPNMAFKKTYFEQLMFAKENSSFPIGKAALSISKLFGDVDESDEFPNLKKSIYATSDTLFYTFMLHLLKIWQSSKAQIDDFEIVMKLMYVLLNFLEEKLSQNQVYIVESLDSLNDLAYEDLKKYQREQIKFEKSNTWNSLTKEFSESLHKQVFDFVKEQRNVQLAKGSWVYSEDPVEATKNNSKPKLYFMILTPNFRSIIYKEFKEKSSRPPKIDKNGILIDINQIAKTEIEESQATSLFPSNSKLISLNTGTFLEKISLFNSSGKLLLSFYTDTKELSFIWSDGLMMLKNFNNQISSESVTQINDLERIRKGIQLLLLDENDAKFAKDELPNDIPYDEELLASVATNFYYDD
ncbi:hypothetical protein B5S33_g2584 [[Candida] boidinii]|nr:hypothetical protein B5S33_g2584 [[Candida] boidinii]